MIDNAQSKLARFLHENLAGLERVDLTDRSAIACSTLDVNLEISRHRGFGANEMSTTRNRTQEIIPLVASGSALLLELVFIPVVRLLSEYPGILVMQLMLVLIVVLAFCGVLLGAQEFKIGRSKFAIVGFTAGEVALGLIVVYGLLFLGK